MREGEAISAIGTLLAGIAAFIALFLNKDK